VIDAERIGPLLHQVARGRGILPPAVQEGVRARYRWTGVQTMVLLRELGNCLERLAAARVPVIVLKGAALTEAVYRNVALRPMSDVDLLVHQRDLPAARRVLEEMGYAVARAETHPGVLAEHENEMAFHKEGVIATSFDVHWSLFDSPYYQRHIAIDWFWQSAESVEIAGARAQMLGPEALIIHLCGHLALHHASSGLLWWQDIAEVLAVYERRIDWTELLARTRQFGLVLSVRTVLTRLAVDWGAPVPAAALRELRASQPSPGEARVFARLNAGEQPVGQRFWDDLADMPDWRQRLRFARTSLFPSAAYMRQRYRIPHPLLVPLYYPYRWLRGLRGSR
jgi:hypothetical protein